LWEGVIPLAGNPAVPLFVEGDRQAPDAAGLSLARELPRRWEEIAPAVATALFEHFEPYREAVLAGEELDQDLVEMESPRDVWQNVAPHAVLISSLRGSPEPGPIIEIQYHAKWDDEHTLGARIQQWKLFELCGSVLETRVRRSS
jgi:hypothetical protein